MNLLFVRRIALELVYYYLNIICSCIKSCANLKQISIELPNNIQFRTLEMRQGLLNLTNELSKKRQMVYFRNLDLVQNCTICLKR